MTVGMCLLAVGSRRGIKLSAGGEVGLTFLDSELTLASVICSGCGSK